MGDINREPGHRLKEKIQYVEQKCAQDPHSACRMFDLAVGRAEVGASSLVARCDVHLGHVGAVVGCFFVLSWSNSCPSASVLQGTWKLRSALSYSSVPADSQTSLRLQNATAHHLHTFELCEM